MAPIWLPQSPRLSVPRRCRSSAFARLANRKRGSMKAKHAPGYVPNPHYSQEDWNEVSDNPEWTKEDFAKARPFAEVFPEMAAALTRRRGERGPQKTPT